MRILPRYVLKHFLPVFALATVGFLGLYLIVDFFERIDRMMEKNLPLQDIYSYFLLKIPLIVTQGIPMAAILSTIIALGILKRNRELIAMETAGVSPVHYVTPLAVTALVLSFIHFGVSEFAARPLNQRLDNIWEVKVQKKKPSAWMSLENMWYREENTIYQIRLYDAQNHVMEKASIFFLDSQFKLVKRVDARRIVWKEPLWEAEDGVIIRFEGADVIQQRFDKQQFRLNVEPKDFSSGGTFPDNLSWFDLYRYIDKIEGEGFTATPYRVDLHLRFASPLATFVLTLFGIVVALRPGLHGGIAAGVGISLAVAFSFFFISNMGTSLASAGILSPFLGVWAGNMLFCAFVAYFWTKRFA
ncbi:MAG: LPS export ABC transporter permease LptG [Desulfobacteraceae bacterium]|nr:LPS export ABC transporter permease LptG [Desulfobacteraceae bacterium]